MFWKKYYYINTQGKKNHGGANAVVEDCGGSSQPYCQTLVRRKFTVGLVS